MQEFKEEYYNGRDRMNPTLENKIKTNTTDISNNPAFPKVDKNGNPINFIELLAYKRFLDVVKKVKYYTGIEDISGQNGFMRLQMKLQESIIQVFEIEKKHRPFLEKLGVDLVTEEMELPKDAIKIDAKIVDMGAIEKDGFATESKEPSKEQVENQFQVEAQEMEMTPMQVFKLEKEKRRFINLLIQGASKKGHYMFEIRRTELNKLHPELANLYGIVMSINDLTYWLMPENIIEQMANNTQAVAGKEEIEEGNDGTKVKTQGICFPVSLHENIKGVMEVFGTHGLPDSKEAQEMIFNSTDTLMNEVSDIRLGVVVWEKFLKAYPIEVFEEGKRFIQHYIFTKFCSLDADEFFKVSKEILNDNPSGAKYIQKLVDDIYIDIKKRDLDDYGFADGGRVKTIKEADINVGSKFVLANGEVIEIIRLYKENKYEDWVEYTRKGEVYNNKLNSLKNFINHWRADKKESGGMAGLSDVSAMLPNPLPMSTITPMANGGGVGYTKKDILNFIKQLKNIQEDISEYKKELDNKNLSEWEIDNIENNKLPELSVQESHIINQLQWGTKNYFSINGKPLVVNQEIYDFLQIQGIFADGGQPIQYVPVQQMPQQNIQYVPVQQMPQQMPQQVSQQVQQQAPQQPVNSPLGNLDINSAIEFVKQNPQILAMLENGGSVQDEINYLNNRIRNLEELIAVINEDEKAEMYATIIKLKQEREHLKKNGNKSEEVKNKKSFFGLFAKGGELKLPKNNARVHFTDDQNKEFDGIFIEETDDNVAMFLVGFGEGSSDFRFPMEVVDWHYLDDKDNNDAHARHEASETAEEEKAEHEYDVYDNKRMLKNQAIQVQHHSEELNNQVGRTKKVPAWVITKMERATTDLSDITHYLDGENKMANGGKVGEVKYEILPHINKFIVAKVTYKQHEDYTYPSKDFIYGFNGKFLEFNDMKSAQKFIDNIEPKYPYGIPKANLGMILMASELLNKQQAQQQPQQPQVVYYVPQPQPQPQEPIQEEQNTGIVQNIPEMASGGNVGYDDELVNDFCITNLIELANELQSVKYYVTHRFKETDFESKNYKGRLVIVFKESASVNVVNSITKFIERAEDCHHLFEQSVNVSGSEPNSLSINLLSDKFADREFGKGGKVYDYAPKKINLAKTKKITTHIGDFNLGLITKDFVYFVNPDEGDENGNTIMYNKKGELLSDNYFASNDLFETLENQSTFEFIHPDLEKYRQEILKGN
jgi:hypothetical protein